MDLSVLGGNWIDLAILLFLLLSLFGGWQRGFLGGFLDLLGFLLSFLLALKFYPLGAKFLVANFSLSLGIAKALGFLFIAILAEIIFSILLGIVHSALPSKVTQAFFNRLLGFFSATLQTLIFVTFILVLILALPVRGAIKKDILSSKIGKVLVSQTQGIEQQFTQVFGGAIEETLNFFTIRPESNETVDLRFVQKELTLDYPSEKVMFQLVNKERKERGLEELSWDEDLAKVARAHAKDMFERGYFSHYTPATALGGIPPEGVKGLSPAERLLKAGIGFLVTGENLALAPSVELAHQGLMESPGHRANILSEDFGKAGVGVVDGGVYGKMFVQEFTD